LMPNNPTVPPSSSLRLWEFPSRTRLIFAAWSLNRTGELARELGATKILLVTDAGIVAAGHADRARASLESAGLQVTVFDRVRENMGRGPSRDLEMVVNRSLVETLGRQLNTTLTVLLAVAAVFLLGGQTIHNFMLALLIGVVVSAYSSLLLASQLLVAWEKRAPTGRK